MAGSGSVRYHARDIADRIVAAASGIASIAFAARLAHTFDRRRHYQTPGTSGTNCRAEGAENVGLNPVRECE